MRTSWLLILGLLAAVACDDPTGPQISGNYSLVAIGNQPVPGAQTGTTIDNQPIVVQSGTLEISRRRYSEFIMRIAGNTTGTLPDAGAVNVSMSGAVTFQSELNVEKVNGVFGRDTLRYTYRSQVYVWVRR